MKSSVFRIGAATATFVQSEGLSNSPVRKPVITRFGDLIDVRNRGAFKLGKFAGSQAANEEAPAVVRLWTNQQFRELSIGEARALAAQLLAAASLAEQQNNQDNHRLA